MSTEPRRLGKYELRQRMASGGQGEVWKAFDLQLHRYVAIKQLNAGFQGDPDFIARFELEAQFIASLHHPNIVKIHDFQFVPIPGTNTSVAYMVMDFIEGPNLAEYIRTTSRKGQFPSPSDVISLFTPVSLALDYAHQKGMIHRDIKPANIMLDRRNPNGRAMGEPILTDFGIAKLQGGSADTTKVLGTPLYVSPEQAQGLTGDQRSDLYSLGIVLYEVMTGVTPFRNNSMMVLLLQHYKEAPPPPESINPTISPEVSAVLLKSIAKDPDARYPSASAMTIALAEALKVPVPAVLRQASQASVTLYEPDGYNPLAPPSGFSPASLPLATVATAESDATLYPPTYVITPPPQPSGKQPNRKLLLAGVALLLVLALGGAAAFFALKGSGNTPPVATNNSAGQVLFLSSPNTAGALDTVQLQLQHIEPASGGQSYYAWIETHDDSIAPVHWSFASQNGVPAPQSYTHPQHQNLLTVQPYLFLITRQSASTDAPSFNPTDLIYYASIPQGKSHVDNFSLVNHLNFLLTSDPRLEQLGLANGIRFWLLKNTQALSQEANAAKTAWLGKQGSVLRQHLVNLVYYLAGSQCAPSALPGSAGQPESAIAHAAGVSLLDCTNNSVITGLLAASKAEMQGIAQAPGVTQYQKTLASQLQTKLTQVTPTFNQLQQSTLQLLQKPDDQLFQPSTQSLIDQLVTLASATYSGQTTIPGLQQIGTGMQNLPTFDVFTCPQSSDNNICKS